MILHKRDNTEGDRSIKKTVELKTECSITNYLQILSVAVTKLAVQHEPSCTCVLFLFPKDICSSLSDLLPPEQPHGAISCPVSNRAESPPVGAAVLLSPPCPWTQAGLRARLSETAPARTSPCSSSFPHQEMQYSVPSGQPVWLPAPLISAALCLQS